MRKWFIPKCQMKQLSETPLVTQMEGYAAIFIFPVVSETSHYSLVVIDTTIIQFRK